MKTIPALFIAGLISASAYAQMDPEMNTEERKAYENRQKEDDEFWKKLGIRTHTTYLIKDGDSIPVWKYECDREGRTMNSTKYRKNGKEKEHWDFTWDDQHRMTSNRKSRNGKELSGTNWTYSGTNPAPAEIVFKKKNGKTNWRTIRKFDKIGNVILIQSFTGKREKPGWRYEYDFYENGSKKEVRYYNPKGKLKEVYTYDCNLVPKTEKEMLKDTLKACIKYETDADGNKIKIIEEQDEKGRLKVTRLTRDKKDRLISAVTTGHKGKIITSYTAEYNESDLVVRSSSQHPKGLRTFRASYAYTYDTEGKTTQVAALVNNKAYQYVRGYTKF